MRFFNGDKESQTGRRKKEHFCGRSTHSSRITAGWNYGAALLPLFFLLLSSVLVSLVISPYLLLFLPLPSPNNLLPLLPFSASIHHIATMNDEPKTQSFINSVNGLIVDVAVVYHTESRQHIVLWSDILNAFPGVANLTIRNGTFAVPLAKYMSYYEYVHAPLLTCHPYRSPAYIAFS